MMRSGDGWWLLALPLLILCMVMMGQMKGHGHTSHRAHNGGRRGQRSGGAEHILAERLARGEIDTDEYESRLAALRTAADLDRTEEVRHVT